jgi:hypothetical protein
MVVGNYLPAMFTAKNKLPIRVFCLGKKIE